MAKTIPGIKRIAAANACFAPRDKPLSPAERRQALAYWRETARILREKAVSQGTTDWDKVNSYRLK